MARTISVGQLRQNPTQMLREVKAGATYTITDHGDVVAAVVPRGESRWVSSDDVGALLRTLGADEDWAREIDAGRAVEDASDPWGSIG